ncbi:sensor histidine kinase [Leucobacter chromiireducens]|uniref:sensor histidine kinase n=1 Tax=Leucobacter chromiireducens TaxID=283877 RepID=UPI000F637A84|nr:HAMP domain-containing sensor histidine kinase [Leucobacter chromiireducens]
MRRAVLIPLLLFSVVLVIALLVPTMTHIADSRAQRVMLTRQESAEHLALVAKRAIDDGAVSALQEHIDRHELLYDEPVLVIDAAGRTVASTGGIDPKRSDITALVTASARTLPPWDIHSLTPWSNASVLVTEPVIGGVETSIGTLVLEANLQLAKRDVARAWTLTLLLAAALLTGLTSIALWWTGWVLRPVRALDAATRALPDHAAPRLSPSGPPELRALATNFDTMAAGVTHALAQQRAFVADASHQLRNPLAAIRLRLDAQELGTATPDDLRMINEDTERLERIVNRMLRLAGVEHRVASAENGVPTSEPRVRLLPSAAALAAPHRVAHERLGQRLRASGGPAIVAIALSDVEEMLTIALENAQNYAGAGATVSVTIAADAEWTELTISDDGPGLTEAELVQAQARFWRADGARAPGTGLGLAILTHLARANGGTAHLAPAAEGGLAVHIRLPSATEEP